MDYYILRSKKNEHNKRGNGEKTFIKANERGESTILKYSAVSKKVNEKQAKDRPHVLKAFKQKLDTDSYHFESKFEYLLSDTNFNTLNQATLRSNGREGSAEVSIDKRIEKDAFDQEYEDYITNGNFKPELIMDRKYPGGEGRHHKRLKEHVANNPEVVGLDPDVIKGKNLYELTESKILSGDAIDVRFTTSEIDHAVEVKGRDSSDSDIRRGLYQCCKYRYVLEQMNAVDIARNDGVKKAVSATLVLECDLPENLIEESKVLKVQVVPVTDLLVIP